MCVCLQSRAHTPSPQDVLSWLSGLSAGPHWTARLRFLSRSPHIRSPLCTSLHLIHLVIAAKFLPSLQHRLPPRWPLQLSAAYNLLITLHPSTPVSEHCAFPQFTPIFFLKLPLFTPYCLLTHFIILNLASISLSLPHPWKVQESSFWLFSLSPHC